MAVFKLGPYNKEMSESESEDDIAALKRRSLVMLEQSLDTPCDHSPLEPRTMREAEQQDSMNNSINVEKLLMERVMLRKEMKLRSVQEMLVDTSHKLEQAEERLEEYESLPLFRQYLAWCGVVRWWQEEAGVVRRGVLTGLSLLYQMFLAGLSLPCLLFHQLPASLQLLCLSFVTQLASVVGESAENYTNECRERSVDTRDSSKNKNNNNNNVVTRRRRRS